MSFHRMNTAGLFKLNKEQREAVNYGIKGGKATQHRPLLIVAGAGTGKTRVLSARAGRLISCGAKPERMFVATFTRRASQELVERVQSTIRAELDGVSVRLPYAGTFHSIANNLLREFASQIGLTKMFTVLDQEDAKDLMDIVRMGSGKADDEKALPSTEVCCDVFAYSRNANLSLRATLSRRFPSLIRHRRPLATIFKRYVRAKLKRNCVDYDDLLVHLATLLRKPRVGDTLRRRFDYVLVDEFQDTNRLQFKIVKLLKPDGRGVTVVGDDAQAIYSFRAATVKNIRTFPTSFALCTKVVSLARNYRSTSKILKASNAVISLADDAFEKKLWSKRKSHQLPILTTVKDERGQARHVVKTILSLQERRVKLKQQAVLVRTSHESALLEVELQRSGVPFRKWGGLRFLEAAHIKDVLAVLRWHENPRDQLAGFRALLLLDGIGKVTAHRVLKRFDGMAPHSLLRQADMPAAAQGRVNKFRRLSAKLSASEWPASLHHILKWYRRRLKRKCENKLESKLADLEQLAVFGGEFESGQEFLANVALDPPAMAKRRYSEDDPEDVLTLSTIHSAKGLEWRSVMILNVMEGCIPSARAKSSAALEEERRLLYVAMTRARDRLELVYPRRNFQPDPRAVPVATVFSRRSQFLPRSVSSRFVLESG
ncbi:ATP-dependent helicase [Bradyrhizobium sp. USDA 336]|uniref:ATP-dependent helicase n=1 Tax=Bradyrhizobium sp. USDA 336 TaxID=3156311 RepID=UPI003834FE24